MLNGIRARIVDRANARIDKVDANWVSDDRTLFNGTVTAAADAASLPLIPGQRAASDAGKLALGLPALPLVIPAYVVGLPVGFAYSVGRLAVDKMAEAISGRKLFEPERRSQALWAAERQQSVAQPPVHDTKDV